jgi:dTDP-4-dehydrorhamnose 3,5-epimerase
MPFDFEKLPIPGLILIKPRVIGDNRGFFLELYKRSDFVKAGIAEQLVQDNYSRSAQGVLRGLHYQKTPKAQGKLVMCMKGSIFDVAVDIRKGSPHFGKWAGVELNGENRHMIYVPAGFAHGFQVLSDFAEVLYKCTEEYSPEHERGITWNDPDIAVSWPIKEPTLSAKDKINGLLRDADNDFAI